MSVQLADLPPPPAGKTGWPWTVETVSDSARSDSRRWPKISLVTPSFNQGSFIEETIRSILLQGYPNLEYIVMDGGSTDETVEIIRKYEPWISFWVSAPDGGQVDALNRAFPKTTGEILNWVNSDDLLLPGALFTVAELFGLNAGIDMVSGARLQRSVGTGTEQVWAPWLNQWPMIFLGFPLYPQECTFFSRKLWLAVGKFDENLDYAFDGEFFSRATSAAEKIVFTEATIGVMHAYAGQKSLRADATMIENQSKLRRLILSALPWAHRPLVRLCYSRFWIAGDAILRCLVYRRARRKFHIGAYDWQHDKWELKSL